MEIVFINNSAVREMNRLPEMSQVEHFTSHNRGDEVKKSFDYKTQQPVASVTHIVQYTKNRINT